MKKDLLFVMVVFIVVTFSSCGKEMDSTNNVIPKNVLQNPYEIFGQYHNEAMQIIYDSAVAGKPMDLPIFVCNFTAKKMSIYSHYDYEYWMKRFVPCMNFINNQFFPFYNNLTDIDFSNDFFKSLTIYQRNYLDRIFNCMESAHSKYEYYDSLQTIEMTVLTNNIVPEWEKGVVLGTISIAKYSFDFVVKHFPEEKAPRWFEKVKKVAKADALGFVSGAIGSVISGHAAAATMTFGPHGTVAVIAGDATVGAITSSGVAVVEQIVTP